MFDIKYYFFGVNMVLDCFTENIGRVGEKRSLGLSGRELVVAEFMGVFRLLYLDDKNPPWRTNN